MNLVLFDNPADCKAGTWPFLLAHEAENNLMIGVITQLAAGNDSFMTPGARPLLCAVQDGTAVVAAGMMTPPFNLGLTRAPDAAIEYLACHLHERNISLPGVGGPSRSVEVFSAAWSHLTGRPMHRNKALRIYQLDRVTGTSRAPGTLCQASPADLGLIIEWSGAFCADCHLGNPSSPDRLRRRIDNREYFLWKGPHAVSMASAAGPTPSGIRIGSVYTPPALRNRGYASALVAALSQYQLDAGCRFCFLYTDLANPTSNSIYQKIGYRPVCDCDEYLVAPA